MKELRHTPARVLQSIRVCIGTPPGNSHIGAEHPRAAAGSDGSANNGGDGGAVAVHLLSNSSPRSGQ
jgi:hypothetical protein